jgi:dolichol-phosphate mannosyltransferase
MQLRSNHFLPISRQQRGGCLLMDHLDLTVIMPAYNEEGAIGQAISDIQRDILALVPCVELIVINDGSKDATGPLLDQMARRESRMVVIHQANGGHGSALLAGLAAARGDFIFLLDSDRQIPAQAFCTLWSCHKHYDAVTGVRAHRDDPWVRLLLTRLVKLSLRLFFGVNLRDANVPFKLFRKAVWEAARPVIPEGTLAPSLFLAIFIKQQGMKLAEIEVPHQERSTGVVSIRKWKLIKFCWRAFRQLMSFRRRLIYEK